MGALVALAQWLGFGAAARCSPSAVKVQLAAEFPGEHFTQTLIVGDGLAALALGAAPVLLTTHGARLVARRLADVAHWQVEAGHCTLEFADLAAPRLRLPLRAGEEAQWQAALAAAAPGKAA